MDGEMHSTYLITRFSIFIAIFIWVFIANGNDDFFSDVKYWVIGLIVFTIWLLSR